MPYNDESPVTITIKGAVGERVFENVAEFGLVFRTAGTPNAGSEVRGDVDVLSFLTDLLKHMSVGQRFLEMMRAKRMEQEKKGILVPSLQLIKKDGRAS